MSVAVVAPREPSALWITLGLLVTLTSVVAGALLGTTLATRRQQGELSRGAFAFDAVAVALVVVLYALIGVVFLVCGIRDCLYAPPDYEQWRDV